MDDVEGLLGLCRLHEIDLVVVGPEAPLVAGVADELGAPAWPCSARARRPRESKGRRRSPRRCWPRPTVPTASALDEARAPCVVKADGLAAGKGVFVCRTQEEADAALDRARALGGDVVVEELLEGEEVSLFALCDGQRALPLAPAQDFKRLVDGDEGPNTGGMGSYSPVPLLDQDDVEELAGLVHRPVIAELARRGTPFAGLLYAGLMLTESGPRVLEFNCRFGDPETQALLPRIEGDLLEALAAAAHGDLAGVELGAGPLAAVAVVLAAGGYPDDPESGIAIGGVEVAGATGALVFHAGTALRHGELVSAGGRVLERGRHGGLRRGGARPGLRRGRADRLPGRALPNGCRLRGRYMSQAESHLHEVPFAALEEFEDAGPLVGILIGSESDREGIEPAVEELNERGISNELRVLSAHRDPRGVAEYASTAALRGVRVIIAGAGMSAALPGAVAAYTELPVIGVPMTSSKTAAGGLDAILSIVQMPPGVPVACVSLNGARNAAILAAKILAQGGGYPIGPSGPATAV